MYKSAPVLARLDRRGRRRPAMAMAALARAVWVAVKDEPFQSSIKDFYLTNPIARASAVMAEMSALKKASAPAPSRVAAE